MIQRAIPIIVVSDSLKAESYYCDVLGFQRVFAYRPDPQKNDPCYFGVARDGVVLHLHSYKLKPERVGLGGAYLYVDDVDQLYSELSERGAIVQLSPTDQTWGTREMAVRDPDGNVLSFGISLKK